MANDHDEGGMFVRPRLLQRLDGLRRGQVALIAAPPGYAKAQLLNSWLDASDDLHALRVEPGQTLAQVHDEARALAAANPSGLVIVVVASAGPVTDLDLVNSLIDMVGADPQFRLVIIARMRPELRLGALAARGRLIDIDGPELAYTREELGEVQRRFMPDATSAQVDWIMSETGGWPVIVDFAASVQRPWEHPERVRRLASSYFGERIMPFLDDADIDLLKSLSAMPSLDPQSAAVLSGRPDAAAQLTRLQSVGAPVHWDGANSISVNPAFNLFLRHQLLVHEPEKSRAIVQRSVLYLRGQGREVDAVRLAMDARDPELAWAVTGEYIVANLHRRVLAETWAQMRTVLPGGWQSDLITAVTTGLATPASLVSSVAAIDHAQVHEGGEAGRLGYVTYLLGLLRRAGYPIDADVSGATHIADNVADTAGDMLLAFVACLHCEYGLWLLHSDRTAEANERLLRALGAARIAGVPWVVVVSLGALAFINAEQGNRKVAARLVEESREQYAAGDFLFSRLDEYAALAEAVLDLEDAQKLSETIAELEETSHHPDKQPELDAILVTMLSLAYTTSGDARSGLRLVNVFRSESHPTVMDTHRFAVAAAALRAHVMLGDLEQAKAELDTIEQLQLQGHQPWLPTMQAQVALAEGRPEDAYRLLTPVTEAQGMPSGRLMLVALSAMAAAAAQCGHPDVSAEAAERSRVLEARMGIARRPVASLLSPMRMTPASVNLTDAERNVLRQLNGRDTLTGMAERMYISPNTLKTHLRRIYKKLGVASREEALERARALGLSG